MYIWIKYMPGAYEDPKKVSDALKSVEDSCEPPYEC